MSEELIRQHLETAQAALDKAQEIADKHNLTFDFSIGEAANVGRDIGGKYYPKGTVLDEDAFYDLFCEYYNDEIEEGDVLTSGQWSAWQSSSEEC